MKDTFALKNPGKISYTYIHTLGNSLIDRIFVSKNIKAKDIMTCRHVVFPASDHLAVKLVIDLGKVNCKTIRAPFWKLNASVLEEELFCQEFQELWERLQYKKRHFGHFEYVDLWHEYKELINRLEKGRKLRGRIEAQDTNELSSIANLVKERTKWESKLVKKIKSGGSVTTNQDEIAKHFKEFFGLLWKKEPFDKSKRGGFIEQIENKVDPLDAEFLKQPLCLEEIKTAVFSLKEEKAPGVDGIPIEVYKTFWPYLKETLLNL